MAHPPARSSAEKSAKTLYLIDGHAQMFRAYHAIRTPLSSPTTGEPTQAVYGFAVMLLKVLNQYRPDYLAIAIDTPGKTFRDELYPAYKATRDKAPEDFAAQIKRIIEMIRLFNIPLLGREGAEADDVIATIAEYVETLDPWAGVNLRIVSKDKDLQQLLSERVAMFDVHTDELLDVAGLKAKLGITPRQVVDMLTLMGDTVDNVPGVAGIGPKTAAQLLAEYGSLEGIYDNLDKIKGKRHENLAAARDHLPLTRRLVTLKRDVDIELDPAAAAPGGVDIVGLRQFFQQMGFRRLDGELDKLARSLGEQEATVRQPTSKPTASSPAAAFGGGLFDDLDQGDESTDTGAPAPVPPPITGADDCAYQTITTREQLDDLVATLREQKLIALDTETIGLGPDKPLCGICLAWQPKAGVYVPTRSPEPVGHLDERTVLDMLRPILEDATIAKCGHNIKYDLRVLLRAGVHARGVIFDSMIAAFLAGLPSRGMDDLSRSLLGHAPIPISALIGERDTGKGGKSSQATMDTVPLDRITAYAAEDADITLRLHDVLSAKLAALDMIPLAERIEMPLVEVLADMEHAGIRVDPDELARQGDELRGRIAELRDQLHEAAGGPFNPDSPKQLAEVLFTHLGLPVVKRTRTGPSTDIEVLEKLADPDNPDVAEAQRRVPQLMVEYRQLTKLVGTYLTSLADAIDPKTGRVHASFHQTGAATGRLSSSGPNLQNIPIRTEIGKQVRKAFVAEPGHRLISADYSQIELRVLAHLSGDKALRRAFEAGQDIHRSVAAEVFNVKLDDVTKEQRARAKVINFGIVYGVTPYGLSRRIEGLDVPAAKQLIADYRRRFSGIDAFLEKCIAHAADHGYVKTFFGRRRAIPEIHSSNPNRRALGERLAINTVVQGSAADLIKLAMVNLHRRIQNEKLPMRLLLQIHDELVVEAPEADAQAMATIVIDVMRHAMDLSVPLDVEAGIGVDWLNAK